MNLKHLSEFKGVAIVDKNGSYSFNELVTQIDKYSNNLIDNSNIINRVVVIDSDYSFYSIALLFALLNQNCIVVPIVKTTDVEFNSKILASEAQVIVRINDNHNLEFKILNNTTIIHEDFLNILNKNRSGIVLFSSGTTGEPKVMVHDYNNFVERFNPPRNQKTLRFLLFLMFDHIGGLNTLFNCINNGSPIIIPENRNPSVILDIIETKKVQIFPTSPTFLNLMLQVEGFENRDLSSLKLITYGTEKMPKILLEKLNILLPNVKYLQTFGTSETGILRTQSKSSNSLYFKIIDETAEYKIENNQLLIKSKTAVAGYKDAKSNKFTEDGWFITGDLIELDEDGYMRIIGRINDIINVGGLKVLPSEVEEVINSIDGVIDSTVFARDNAITGQVVCAKIVVKRDTDIPELKKLIRNTCSQKLDKYKNPVKIIITDTIEYTARFKKDNNDREH